MQNIESFLNLFKQNNKLSINLPFSSILSTIKIIAEKLALNTNSLYTIVGKPRKLLRESFYLKNPAFEDIIQ